MLGLNVEHESAFSPPSLLALSSYLQTGSVNGSFQVHCEPTQLC